MNIYLVQDIESDIVAYTSKDRAFRRAKELVEKYSKEAHEEAKEETRHEFLFFACWSSYDYVYVKKAELIH